ncbi:hypothetical protein C4J95_4474 [Pseudomonas orientalis]|nr:hypothetical protein C4J95_4474 [Pseudomonas orientalis]
MGSKYPTLCAAVTGCATVWQGNGLKSWRLIHLVGGCYPPGGNFASVAHYLLSNPDDAPSERANA